jgi:hypothetical protein
MGLLLFGDVACAAVLVKECRVVIIKSVYHTTAQTAAATRDSGRTEWGMFQDGYRYLFVKTVHHN